MESTEDRNKDFIAKFEKAKNLFIACLNYYNTEACQCAYPRFQQIIGIDSTKSGDSFKSQDTDLLIALSTKYFDIQKSDRTDECKNDKWVCKKCGSVYEYGWSDFSIYVERQKLELTDLKVSVKGQPAVKPIPLYLGLMGHSYPSRSEIIPATFEEFENYMTEK